ncbi:MAG: cell division protein FtsZ, partial [Comamonadaceae bacterium]
MSSLTVALAILGGLVLAAVIGYNAWMSRRNAPRQPDAIDDDGSEPTGSLALDGQEPVLHIDPYAVAGNDRHEPLFDPDLPAPSALQVPSAERRGGLDPLIDVIAPVSLDGLASGDAAIAAMPATRRAGRS